MLFLPLHRRRHAHWPLSRLEQRYPRSAKTGSQVHCERQDHARRQHRVSPTGTHFAVHFLTKSHSDQIFTVRQTIAFLSQGTTLLPGSVIMTGTPKGVGFVKKPPVYLKNGDQVTIWVDGGIGTLINDVIEEGKGSIKAKL
jgi:2-keto-4-pentenoate hydratase/2-oxohepta-3-ene-1,7-dioic acid hydratase in catechol pathway